MASSQFLLRQVCCPKGSHWQLGLIYEYRAHHQCSASMGLALFDQQILYNSLSLVFGGVKKWPDMSMSAKVLPKIMLI